MTGAGSRGPGLGNGKATAILFAREGARVLCVDLAKDRADETVGLVRAEGGEAEAFAADVTVAAQCRAMVDAAVHRWGGLDILHNNVGIESRQALMTTTEEEWDRVMTVDLKSMLLTCQAAVPAMQTRGGGSIICVSSVAGLRGYGRTAYAAAKAGVIGFVKSIAVQLGPKGIRVNAIAPGAGVDADGGGPGRRRARAPAAGGSARYRRHRLGHGLGRGLPGERRVALGHRTRAGDRRGTHRHDLGRNRRAGCDASAAAPPA